MAYSADSFTALEVPTLAKMNKLWSNDASFNDGTGIADDAILARHVVGLDKANMTSDINPYKFAATKADAQNTVGGSAVKLTFNTETFDSNNNFASSTYTAPVAGFYQFNYGVSVTGNPGSFFFVALYKNGSIVMRGSQQNANSASICNGSMLVQLAAGNTVEVYVFASNTVALGTSPGEQGFFNGFLVSRT